MRKTAIVLIAVFVFMLSSFSAGARDKGDIEISLSADKAFTNRLFDVNFTSDDIDKIAAGVFTLSYDSSVLEFGKVSSDCFDVKSKTYDDAVKIVFVVDEALGESDKLFSVQFKAKNETQTDVELVSSYVVDRELDVVNVSGVCDVTVNKKETKKEVADKDTAEVSGVSYDKATVDNQSIKLDSFQDKNTIMYIAGCVAIIVAVSVNVWFLFRKRVK